MKKQLKFHEVADILLVADLRTIKDYVEKGLIPKIAVDLENLTIDAQELAKLLKVEDFTEKFVGAEEAQKILDTQRDLTVAYCQNKGIPFTVLGELNTRGRKILFRPSFLKAWKEKNEVKLIEDLHWLEDLHRDKIIKVFNGVFGSIAHMANLDHRAQLIFTAYINGTSVSKISENHGITPDRVLQILNKTTRRLSYFIKETNNWYTEFKNSEYGNLEPKYLYKRLLLTESEIVQLRIENQKWKEAFNQLPAEQRSSYKVNEKEVKDLAQNPFLFKNIEESDVSVRVYNAFKAFGFKTFFDVLEISAFDLLKLRNFGFKSLKELQGLMNQNGLSLKDYEKILEKFQFSAKLK